VKKERQYLTRNKTAIKEGEYLQPLKIVRDCGA